jgi:hypothetical protein
MDNVGSPLRSGVVIVGPRIEAWRSEVGGDVFWDGGRWVPGPGA